MFSWRAIAGLITVHLLWLFIRVYDEYKDADSDMELARAGDMRFVNRPLVTGRVTLADIGALRWGMTILVCAVNLVFFDPMLAVGLTLGFGYITLAYKWFFYPAMQSNIILIYITHLPNVLAIEIYTLFVYVSEYGWPDIAPVVALMLGLWLTIGGYEFAYKIRVPSDETDYMTYSKVLGLRTATLIAIGMFLLSTFFYCIALAAMTIPVWVNYVVVASGVWVIGACTRLLVQPRREYATLTKHAGIYWFVSTACITLGILLSHGTAWN
ncbi:hypothetical protein CLM73_09605 [Achromobacter spanius]|uniref:Prenyltransferase n=2 Tax=Achromobacter spanius TaxID=217203 RepID=A0A2S0I5Q6_9BURK|nr:hypothetical protein CLM73_09605 [Achromobacter spanius]